MRYYRTQNYYFGKHSFWNWNRYLIIQYWGLAKITRFLSKDIWWGIWVYVRVNLRFMFIWMFVVFKAFKHQADQYHVQSCFTQYSACSFVYIQPSHRLFQWFRSFFFFLCRERVDQWFSNSSQLGIFYERLFSMLS